MNQVRVTLEKPYAFDQLGKERPLVLRYGSEGARTYGAGSAVSLGRESYAGDDLVDAGSEMDRVPRSIAQVVPGRRREWMLSTIDKDQNGLLVPVEAARLWFGDWRLPREAPMGTPREDTWGFERDRVALRWGWWKMPRTTASGSTHLGQGRDVADMTKIGPPAIPYVLIEDVDGRGRSTGKLRYRPWDVFRWEDDVIPGFDPQAQSAGAPVAAFTESELRAMLAEIEARTKAKS